MARRGFSVTARSESCGASRGEQAGKDVQTAQPKTVSGTDSRSFASFLPGPGKLELCKLLTFRMALCKDHGILSAFPNFEERLRSSSDGSVA